MTANKNINGIWINRAIRTYIYAHESRDTIKQWSFDKIVSYINVNVKAMQFPISNVNIDV